MIGKMCLCAAAVAITAGAANASLFQSSQTLPWSFPLSPGSETLLFDQFDDLDGARQLKEVRISFEGMIGGRATAENDSVLAAPGFGVSLSGSVEVTVLGGVMDAIGIVNMNEVQALDATDGVRHSGPDYHEFGDLADVVSGSDSTTSDLGSFVGLGTVAVDVDGLAGFSFFGTTDATLGIDDLRSEGEATLTYVFLPTPGAAGLALLGGVVGIRRRRG